MVEEISPEDVKEKIESGEEFTVVDIRQRAQYERGHIPGAINVPLNELPARIEEYDWDEEIVVACPIGQSSIQAARLIGSYEGVEDPDAVQSMEGGYQAWDYDLEVGDGESVGSSQENPLPDEDDRRVDDSETAPF